MDIYKNILEYLGYLLAGGASYYIYKLKKEAKTYDIKKTMRMTDAQYKVYKKVVELVDGNIMRSYILEFHNGDNYISKINGLKMSCTYEFVRTGYESTSEIVKDKPLTLIADIIHGIINKKADDIDGLTLLPCISCSYDNKCLKCVYRVDTKELDFNYLRSLFDSRDVEVAYITMLSYNDNIYGLLIMEIRPGVYISNQDEHNIVEKMHSAANTISLIMGER